MKLQDYNYVVIYERKDFRSHSGKTTFSVHGFQIYSNALRYAAKCKTSHFCVSADIIDQVQLRAMLSSKTFCENNFLESMNEKIR